MTWNQTTRPVTGNVIPKTWGEQISDAIAQIAKDLYLTPINNGVDNPTQAGIGNLAQPLQKSVPIAEGIGTTAGVGESYEGFEVLLSPEVAADDYRVFCFWQEDPGEGSGDLYPIKGSGGFYVINTGATKGKKFAYIAYKGLSA